MTYKIALVDDNPEVLNHLTMELQASGQADIVFTAINGSDYLLQMEKLQPGNWPQAVIMDIEMPVLNGIEAVRASSLLYENIQYIMFTVADDDNKLFDAIKAGADGYLLKDEAATIIINAIKEVVDGNGAPMSPSIARKTLKLLARPPEKSNAVKVQADTILSDREIEILKGMVAGLNYKQIADKAYLSPFTIRNHITKIYTKLHIRSKAQAVKLAVNNKWV